MLTRASPILCLWLLVFSFLVNIDIAFAHNAIPSVQEDSLVVVAAPLTPNRSGALTVTATVFAHRTGPGAFDTNWNIELSVPSGYSITSGDNPQIKTSNKHGSVAATWQLTAPAQPGEETFTVTASATDAILGIPITGSPEIDTFTISIPNNDPVAENDHVTTTEDTPVTVNVLSNDTDADNDLLFISSISSLPSNGIAEITDSSNTMTYTPNANFVGADQLTFTIQDPYGGSATESLTILVTPVNDPPEAVNDSYQTDEETPLTVTGMGVIENDSDIEGDSLSAMLEQDVESGVLVLYGNGSFTYSPNNDFDGLDSFSYILNDGSDDGIEATVSIMVNSINDAPIATPGSYATLEDNSLNVAAPGVLESVIDAENDPLSLVLIDDVANGTLALYANGSFSYVPDSNYYGFDSFSFVASDGYLNSSVGTVNITISAVNDVPIANNATLTVEQDDEIMITLEGSDVESIDDLLFDISRPPIHGTLVGFNVSSGIGTYIPAADYAAEDNFTFFVSDGSATSNIATVIITIDPVDGTPQNDDEEPQDEQPDNEQPSNQEQENTRERSQDNNRREMSEEELASKRITYADEYFQDKPLEKIKIQTRSLLNSDGALFSSLAAGEKSTFSYDIRNYQQRIQEYCFIVEIVDSSGVTISLHYSTGEIAPGEVKHIQQGWQAQLPGEYQAKVFIWDGFDKPLPLAHMDSKNIRVT